MLPTYDRNHAFGTNSACPCRFERADERTRTAYPCSLRVIGHTLQRFARTCKYRIPKRVPLLWVAGCCTVLRSRWYQSGIKRCQEFGHWRSHAFLWSLLVPVAPSKRTILPCDRFEMLFGQPFAYVGFYAEGDEEVREHHHVLVARDLGGFRQLSPLSRIWSVEVSISTTKMD
jgi:hypothetical protein